jgi:hypothetical protein
MIFSFVSLQNAAAPSPLGQMTPQDGMPGGPMPPGFFPVSTEKNASSLLVMAILI